MYNEVETGITTEYVFPRALENRKPYLNKIFFIQGSTTPVSSALGRTQKFIPSLYPHRGTRGVGVDGTPPQSFCYVALSISKRICLR